MADVQGVIQPRVIGAYDAPQEHGQRTGIEAPPVESQNFEIKASLINMVSGAKFHGLPMEDPLDHLDNFERLCGTVKIHGVSEDAFKLRLFSFSLGDKAHTWEKSLAKKTIVTWNQCKKEFLSKFFSSTRTARLRNDISGFTQKNNESFHEAWERFKGYTTKCPHHGFSDESILSTLYRGLVPKYRSMLDTASNGNFLGKNIEEGLQLVENLALSDEKNGEDYDRAPRGNDDDKTSREMKSLREMMTKVLQATERSVNYIGEYDGSQVSNENQFDGSLETQEEMNFVGNQGNYQGNYQGGYNRGYNPNYGQQQGQGYQQRPFIPSTNQGGQNYNQQGYVPKQPFQGNQGGFQNNQGGYQNRAPFVPQAQQGYKPAAQAAPAVPQGYQQDIKDMKTMYQQMIAGQTSLAVDVNKKINEIHIKVDGGYQDLNTKLENLSIHVKGLDNQIAQVASTSEGKKGVLPGKAEANPKEYCLAITLSSEKQLPTREIEQDDSSNKEKNVENKLVDDNEEQGSQEVIPTEPETEKYKEKQVVEPRGITEKVDNFEPRTYEPKLPFPGRFKKQILDQKFEKFKKLMKTVEVTIPFADLILECPIYNKLLKDVITKKKQVEDAMVGQIGMKVPNVHEETEDLSISEAEDLIQAQCAEIIEELSPKKLADPGCFLLNCQIGEKKFDGVLCDSGSSVNVIPLSSAKGLGEIQPCPWTITFADQSVKKPAGWLLDVPIKIKDHVILTDFVVMELEKEPKEPLILGRGFLATAGAVIDFKHGLIHLHLPEEIVKFKMDRGPEAILNGESYHDDSVTAVVHKEKVPDIGKKKGIVKNHPKRSTTPNVPATAVKQKAPDVKLSFLKREVFGTSHAPDAYLPPWRKRLTGKYSLPKSKPSVHKDPPWSPHTPPSPH